MDFARYLRALRAAWWIVVIAVLLGGGAGEVQNLRSTPQYETTLTFYVQVASTSATASNPASTYMYAVDRAVTYAVLLSSERLGTIVAQDYGSGMTATGAASMISGSARLDTTYVDATVLATSPERSLAVGQIVARRFPALVASLDNSASGSGPTVNLELTSGPTLMQSPVSPRTKLNLLVGVAAGLALGLIIVVLRDLANTSVSSAAEIAELFTVGVAGDVPFEPRSKTAPLLVGTQVHSQRAEAMRHIRTNIMYFDVDQPPRVLLVTSASAGEGKSTTATNLSLSFAETALRTLLIEADLRRPRVSDYLDIERAVGLTSVLSRQATLDEAIVPWSDSLSVLPSGELPPNPAELLNSRMLARMIKDLRGRFDMIVIDSPPLLAVTDAAVLSHLADGVLLVVRSGKTKRAQLAAAMQTLEAVDARVIGFVLNMTRSRSRSAYNASYAYQFDQQEERARWSRWLHRSPDGSPDPGLADHLEAGPANDDLRPMTPDESRIGGRHTSQRPSGNRRRAERVRNTHR